MQIIIISPNNSTHRHWHLSSPKFFMIAALCMLFVAATAIYINQRLSPSPASPLVMTTQPSSSTSQEPPQTDNDIQEYYVKRLGQLQAESIRLTALTEKLAEIAGLDVSGYDLSSVPAQGGIDEHGEQVSTELFDSELTQLSQRFNKQGQQLASLKKLFLTQDSIQSAIPQGEPVTNGLLSSRYGYRIDPFTGKKKFHSGLDFGGKRGSDIIAVADGIISYTGTRNGYGQIVEIDHGNGYATRYAHNEKVIVKSGDKVIKGQVIALMGSSGRSTGPHVHFEVLREGKAVNPYTFVKR